MRAYVLVGGRSRRMGQPKSEVMLDGFTFLERVVAAARGAFDGVVAVQRTGEETLADVETIHEPPHEYEAAIFGVLTALQHARDRCFVIAVDYPLLTASLLRYLRARFEVSSSSMLVPCWGGHPQLLCSGYAPSLVPLIEARMASGRFDLRGLMDEARAELAAEEELRSRFEGEPLMNVNTPEDLARAASHIHE